MPASNSLLIFGSGDCGQLALGEDIDTLQRPKIHPYFEGRGIVSVAAGGLHTLALGADGRVYSWGCNDEKALGHDLPEFTIGMVEQLPNEQVDDEKVIQLAAGDSISAALTNKGRIFTWGTFRDSKGVLGYNAAGNMIQERPTLLEGLAHYRVISIAAGANHLMALTDESQLFSWGCGEQGQLGRRVLERHKILGLRPMNVTPRLRKYNTKFTKIVCGSYHTLAINQEGMVFAMGLNNYGQLGLGDYQERLTAEPLEQSSFGGHRVVDLGAGEHHSLALTEQGVVYSFGRGDSGQLGIHGSNLSNIPLPIPNLDNIVQIATGGNHNLAVRSSGEVFSWGYGGMHQLGHGPDEDEAAPKKIEIKPDSRIVQIAAGGQHSIILISH